MKTLVLITDGLADRPVEALGWKTPLEVAKKPNLDEITKNGISGLMYTIAPGVPPGSDTAHLALFGYDPYEVYTGRGPFEAAGAEIDMKPGDIAFRVNYATVDDNLVIKDRRAGRVQDTSELEKSLKEIDIPGVEVIFKSTMAHRGVLVVRGKGLSHKVADSDPHEVGVKVEGSKALDKEAEKTAKILDKFSEKAWKILKDNPFNKKREENGEMPANYLLLRGCGMVPDLTPFPEKFGISAACVAAAALVKGVCRMAGMDVPEIEGATGGVNTNLDAKCEAVLKEFETHDLVIMHVKGADEAGHDGDHDGKVKIIERLDEAMGKLKDSADIIVMLIDHTTPVSTGDHSGDPVPVVISGKMVRADDVEKYDERSAAKGALGNVLGKDIMPIVSNFMGKAKKFGA